jgi:hypothetical protein
MPHGEMLRSMYPTSITHRHDDAVLANTKDVAVRAAIDERTHGILPGALARLERKGTNRFTKNVFAEKLTPPDVGRLDIVGCHAELATSRPTFLPARQGHEARKPRRRPVRHSIERKVRRRCEKSSRIPLPTLVARAGRVAKGRPDPSLTAGPGCLTGPPGKPLIGSGAAREALGLRAPPCAAGILESAGCLAQNCFGEISRPFYRPR